MRSRYQDLQLYILHWLYEYAFTEGSLESFREADLTQVLPNNLRMGITHAVLRKLSNDAHLDYDNDGYYSISPEGIDFIERSLSDPNSGLSALLRDEDSSDGNATEPQHVAIPAADRIVSLDHNSDTYKEAIEALEAALAAFKEDRLFQNDWGHEKGILIQTIEAGRDLLNETQVQVATVFASIIAPLKVAQEKYEHALVAGLITAGVDQVLPLLQRALRVISSLFGLQ